MTSKWNIIKVTVPDSDTRNISIQMKACEIAEIPFFQVWFEIDGNNVTIHQEVGNDSGKPAGMTTREWAEEWLGETREDALDLVREEDEEEDN